jgi:signal transduction histidine kinase
MGKQMFRRSGKEMRVLILAPIGRDSRLLAGTLEGMGIDTTIAPDVQTLLNTLPEGIGSAIIAEEALEQGSVQKLAEWVEAQPPWSDTPFLVLTSSGRPTRESHERAQELQALGNLTLIERPARPETVQSSVRAALRARMRQYEIRSRQEALLRANSDLEQFAHSASHDLREPLRSIGVYSELLSRDYAGSLDRRGGEFLGLIRSAAKRMDTLLNDLLSYAHASSFTAETVGQVQAARPLEAALENLGGAIRESEALITVGNMPEVRMHESHLSQIFQNLLGNAIKYRKEDDRPRVDLFATRAEGYWIFSIADNGIGIPSAYKESIFGIFKRLHTSGKYPGTGMGLAICQRIVERYGGRIWVESEPGKGSQFSFSVPE